MAQSIISRRGSQYVKINYDYYYKVNPISHCQVKYSPWGTTTSAGASIANKKYAIFAGGNAGSGTINNTIGFSENLSTVGVSTLSSARNWCYGIDIGSYGLICGGTTNGGPTGAVNTVDTYNSSLIKGSTTLYSAAQAPMTAKAGTEYALVAGGIKTNDSYVTSVTAFSSSLSKTSVSSLSQGRYNRQGGVGIGNYAIFVGGMYASGSYSNKIDVYNSSLTKISTSITLSTPRFYFGSAGIGNYAIFAGGSISDSAKTSTVETVSVNLVRSSLTNLPNASWQITGGKVGNYAIFAGGSTSSVYLSGVYAYTPSLVRTTIDSLLVAREGCACANVGDYILFSSGNAGSPVDCTDAYSSNSEFYLSITKGSKYKFNNSNAELSANSSTTLTFAEPITGYVKMKKGTI